ncbi:alpha/beta fold hydrolase [Polynucleobacter sp. MG-28-Ekke-A2]|uniref:alpha/beta hydrolase n=1 Tax=Polynucleobacter sp. MG-28-Ekke-A2 TaxID=3108276 RepID=UPI002B23BD5B|nr:alpha/beta fold hydrolase [Polynucleobacter sp. MG-28-Ekke-A2]MEA9601222.1 alpha/beta fold hydrolase [Polynucleobacter sp. MG-28-Ekke-A2]
MLEPVISHSKQDLTILIPGLNGSGLELGQLPRFLEAASHDVLIPEIPGFLFGSPASKFSSWVQELHQIIDAQKEIYSTVNLVGISMGATLATLVATQRTDISSLVLMSPVLKYDGWSVPFYRPILDFFYFLGVRNWEYSEREPFGVKNIDLRRRISEKFKTSKVSEVGAASISARHLHEAKGLMVSAKNNLQSLTCRLLIIQSVEDDACSVWSAEEILEHCKSEVRRVIWLGNSYHIVTIDNEREIVLNEVLNFVAQTSAVERHHFDPATSENRKVLKLRAGYE